MHMCTSESSHTCTPSGGGAPVASAVNRDSVSVGVELGDEKHDKRDQYVSKDVTRDQYVCKNVKRDQHVWKDIKRDQCIRRYTWK